MKENKFAFLIALMAIVGSTSGFCQPSEPSYQVSLKEAHIGSETVDTMLLNSYVPVPCNRMAFYLDARRVFEKEKSDFTDRQIIEAAAKNQLSLLGGPLLGNLKPHEVSIWLRPANTNPLTIAVTNDSGSEVHTFERKPDVAGTAQQVAITGLSPNTAYSYQVLSNKTVLAGGTFRTAPCNGANTVVRIAFGSCFHKIGLHNPNLINTILERKPQAMMLLGDIAVDDRNGNVSMHQSDYLLRDLSAPWQKLAAQVPLYASWDDHDYRDNDLSGVSGNFTNQDRENLRRLWKQNWNNPANNVDGIYFNAHIGQVELIMLDTRSCRKTSERGKYGSYLGAEQQEWLKQTLKNSKASFKIISSGTMWSDAVTEGKDSWGTWDTLAREEIFSLIEKENIAGVLLISGDRHGARGFTIPRPSGFRFYEFEAASLGGVPGPVAMADNPTNQLFGYDGLGLKAFGEFTFHTDEDEPQVTFRLINEIGKTMEEHTLTYEMLTPGNNNRN